MCVNVLDFSVGLPFSLFYQCLVSVSNHVVVFSFRALTTDFGFSSESLGLTDRPLGLTWIDETLGLTWTDESLCLTWTDESLGLTWTDESLGLI